MDQRRKYATLVALAVFMHGSIFAVAPRALAVEKSGSVKYSELETTTFVELKGKVLYPDGKTGAAKMSVRVWSEAQQKYIYHTDTSKEGVYELPKLAPGRYVITYAEFIRVDLLVVAEKEPVIRFLNVVVPGFVFPFWIVGGAVIPIIPFIPGGGDGDHPVSPHM